MTALSPIPKKHWRNCVPPKPLPAFRRHWCGQQQEKLLDAVALFVRLAGVALSKRDVVKILPYTDFLLAIQKSIEATNVIRLYLGFDRVVERYNEKGKTRQRATREQSAPKRHRRHRRTTAPNTTTENQLNAEYVSGSSCRDLQNKIFRQLTPVFLLDLQSVIFIFAVCHDCCPTSDPKELLKIFANAIGNIEVVKHKIKKTVKNNPNTTYAAQHIDSLPATINLPGN